ncbi:hypothetical protein [Microbispora corallina]|nr:hypothetical protein [Microbispora corallina]
MADKPTRSASYAPLAVRARLAAALRTLGEWLARTGIQDRSIDELIHHLWRLPTVTADDFRAWEESGPDLVAMALGGPMPAALVEKCNRAAAAPEDLYELVRHTAEIVYVNLYGAVDDHETLGHLAAVEQIAGRYSVILPPAQFFARSPYGSHGWGPQLTSGDVDHWRTADTTTA